MTEALSSQLREDYQKDLAKKTAELEVRIKAQAAEQARLERQAMQSELAEKKEQLAQAQKAELELRKRAQSIEEKEKNLELEMARQADAVRQRASEETARRLGEEFRLKGAEKDKQLEDMRKQIEDLRRKSEQGSQQMQGEVLELELENALRAVFALDAIEPVSKGIRGGDVVQRVHGPGGQYVGTILWETKRTKAWSDGWIEKLKDDQRAISAECAVLVTHVMPKDVSHLACLKDVWVVDFSTYIGIAAALRTALIQVHQAKSASTGKGEKMELLYDYLTGTQYRQRVEAIVDSFRTIKDDLEKEKRAFERIWSAREKQLMRAMAAAAGMYGDVQGIVGASLPRIEHLELGDASDPLLQSLPD